jgi:Zn-finger protein
VVQTVEKKHPGDAGKIWVCTSHTFVHDQSLLGSLLQQAFDVGQALTTFDKRAKCTEDVHPIMSPIFR